MRVRNLRIPYFRIHFEADFSRAAFRGEHSPGTVHAQRSKKIIRGLAKDNPETAMEKKSGKAVFARRALEQNTGLIFGGEEKLRHEEIILRCRHQAK
jgi:hypothetical protein